MAPRSSRRSGARPTPRPAAVSRGPATMPFGRTNYLLLLGAVGLVVVGYALMMIDNATSDNPVDSVLSLYVAPLLLLGGYLGVAAAVLWGVPRDVPADAEAGPAPAAG